MVVHVLITNFMRVSLIACLEKWYTIRYDITTYSICNAYITSITIRGPPYCSLTLEASIVLNAITILSRLEVKTVQVKQGHLIVDIALADIVVTSAI